MSSPSFPAFAPSQQRADTGCTKVPSIPVLRKSTGSSTSQLHPDLKLLTTPTWWRLDMDQRVLKHRRFAAIGWFIKGVHGVILSQPNVNFLQPTQGGKMNIFDGDTFNPVRLIWFTFLLSLLFKLLLGTLVASKHCLGRTQWTQVMKSLRRTSLIPGKL
ncbi:hypothetical protein FRB93_003776 [Tulasnella sp. JGI-2019a]|nr:hypothetical protein FRB93_003776 [Tulasnella sp. JGI-2019a]